MAGSVFLASSFAVGLVKGIVKGKMEDQVLKELRGQVLAACSLKFLLLVHPWQACQPLFSLGHGHFQAKHQRFYNLVTGQMIVVAVMKKILMEAEIQVTQVALGIQNQCLLLTDSLVCLFLLKGMVLGEASLGK